MRSGGAILVSPATGSPRCTDCLDEEAATTYVESTDDLRVEIVERLVQVVTLLIEGRCWWPRLTCCGLSGGP